MVVIIVVLFKYYNEICFGWLVTGLGFSKGILYTLSLSLTILFFMLCVLVFLL